MSVYFPPPSPLSPFPAESSRSQSSCGGRGSLACVGIMTLELSPSEPVGCRQPTTQGNWCQLAWAALGSSRQLSPTAGYLCRLPTAHTGCQPLTLATHGSPALGQTIVHKSSCGRAQLAGSCGDRTSNLGVRSAASNHLNHPADPD